MRFSRNRDSQRAEMYEKKVSDRVESDLGRKMTKSGKYSMKNWVWYGNAKHFIGASNCKFHLATKIGNWIISTVGEYKPDSFKPTKKQVFEEIGPERFYETMVFRAIKCPCGCNEFVCDVSSFYPVSNLQFRGYKTSEEASNGHAELCLLIQDDLESKE